MEVGCFYCGTNAWTTCKHRQGIKKPEPNKPITFMDDKEERKAKHKKAAQGNGNNFYGSKAKLMSKRAREIANGKL